MKAIPPNNDGFFVDATYGVVNIVKSKNDELSDMFPAFKRSIHDLIIQLEK